MIQMRWRYAKSSDGPDQPVVAVGIGEGSGYAVLQYRQRTVTTERLPFAPYGSTEIVEGVTAWQDVPIAEDTVDTTPDPYKEYPLGTLPSKGFGVEDDD